MGVERWATDELFPPGSDDWSGEQTKVAPTAAERLTGFVPDMKAIAEKVNFLFDDYARAINQADAAAGFPHFATTATVTEAIETPGARTVIIAAGAVRSPAGITQHTQSLRFSAFTARTTSVGAPKHLAYSPTLQRWVVAGTTGMEFSDDTVTWSATTGAGASEFFGVVWDPVNAAFVAATAARFVTSVDGENWTARPVFPQQLVSSPDGGLAVNPASGVVFFAGQYTGGNILVRTSDAGANQVAVMPGGVLNDSLRHAAHANGVWIFTGSNGTLIRSGDDGVTLVVQTLPAPLDTYTILSAAGRDDGTLWIASTLDGFILISVDQGLTWTQYWQPLPNPTRVHWLPTSLRFLYSHGFVSQNLI